MRCGDARGMMMTYIRGDLPDDEVLRLKAHLDVCPRCQEAYADEVEMTAAFRTSERGTAGGDFVSEVMTEIDRAPAPASPAEAGVFRLRPRAIAAAAVILAALLAIGYLATDPSETREVESYLARMNETGDQLLGSVQSAFAGIYESGSAAYKDSWSTVTLSVGEYMTVIGIMTALAFAACTALVWKYRKKIAEELMRA